VKNFKLGDHIIIDVCKVKPEYLTIEYDWEKFLDEIVEMTGSTILNRQFHPFPGGALTALYLLAESHLSIHTWTEHQAFCFDMFSCKPFDKMAVLEKFWNEFGTDNVTYYTLDRIIHIV
jgi:S-adenosylmethionine decarboxylase proenzyme